MKPLESCRLYTFIDTGHLHGRAPAEVARMLCDGGSDIVQLRAKGVAPVKVQRMAEEILPVTRAAGVPLVINDYPDVARACGAEMVHLGEADYLDADCFHKTWTNEPRPSLRVGVSTHGPRHGRIAVGVGADYIGVGPVYATATKPGRAPVTLEYVRWAAANVKVPWFAIGGITLANLDEVLAAGARRICAVSAILNAPDVARACAEFRQRLSGG
jgi:thiamine-phosphate pyrophosphorylase